MPEDITNRMNGADDDNSLCESYVSLICFYKDRIVSDQVKFHFFRIIVFIIGNLRISVFEKTNAV